MVWSKILIDVNKHGPSKTVNRAKKKLLTLKINTKGPKKTA